MNRCLISVAALMIFISFWAWQFAGKLAIKGSQNLSLADAEEFWKFIPVADPYTKWNNWSGYEEIYPAKSPPWCIFKTLSQSFDYSGRKSKKNHTIRGYAD